MEEVHEPTVVPHNGSADLAKKEKIPSRKQQAPPRLSCHRQPMYMEGIGSKVDASYLVEMISRRRTAPFRVFLADSVRLEKWRAKCHRSSADVAVAINATVAERPAST